MITIITIVILIACLVLAFFVLIQQPKGGGLAGSFGGLSTQVMGVKQSTDVMEKGTWTSMGIIAALCIICVMFFETPRAAKDNNKQQQSSAPAKQSAPAGQKK
ncbi:MAG: preprotein translocase subunit SecG [Sphingobacteriales bacterium]|nr:MAG: preprotein translocase subunit SecG [Sphingobacteriales bacterium]